MPRLEALMEAERRGMALNERNRQLLDEARRRGLTRSWEEGSVIGAKQQAPPAPAPAPTSSGTPSPSPTPPAPDPHIREVEADGERIRVFDSRVEVPSGKLMNAKYPVSETSVKAPPESGAPTSGIIKSAFTIDPNAKARVFAQSRGEDMSRYKVVDGEVFRKGDDGVYYREIPKTGRAEGIEAATTIIKDMPANIASGVTLMAMGPVGIPAAAGIEAGAEVIERGLARKFLGEDVSAQEVGTRAGVRGVLTLGAGTVAKLAGKGAVVGTNKTLRGVTKTGQVGAIIKNQEEIAPEVIKARARNMGRFGLEDAGVARMAKSPRLGAYDQFLGGQASAAGDVIRARDARLAGSITKAATEGKGGMPKFLTDAEADRAGGTLVQAARQSKTHLYKMRKQRTQPLYAQASREAQESGGVVKIDDITSSIQDKLAKSADNKERRFWTDILDSFHKKETDKTTGETVRTVKSGFDELDRLQKSLLRRMNTVEDRDKYGTLVDNLGDIRAEVMDRIADVAPTYAKATNLYKTYSRAIKQFEGEYQDSLLKRLTKLGPDDVRKAPAMLFGEEVSPQTIRNTKARVLAHVPNGADKWRVIERGAMTDVLEGLADDLTISPRKLENLRAALSPEQYEAVQAYRQALEDIGFVPLAKQAAPGVSEGARVAGRETGGVLPRAVKRVTPSPYIQARAIEENRVRKHAKDIAEELTTAKGIDNILRLKQIPDKAGKYAVLATYLGLQTYGTPKVKRLINE